jgi:hypothetical protein
MDFTVTLTDGSSQNYSSDDALYNIDEYSAALTVTVGNRRWRYSPSGWLSVEDSFGDPMPPGASGARPA